MSGKALPGIFLIMILFFDIDGTLVDEKTHIMPESAKEAITVARKNGHICMINTGRAAAMVGPEIRDLVELDGYVMGCGTTIEYHGEILFHQRFSIEQGNRIIAGLREFHIDAVLEGAENCFCDLPEEMYTGEFQNFVKRWMILGYSRQSIDQAPGHFDKFYCYMGDEEKRLGFMKAFEQELDFIDRERGYYEVLPKGFSKADGMRRVVDYMRQRQEGIKESIPYGGLKGEDFFKTAALGDSNNDLSMLHAADYAVAMEQSSREVLRIADFVTTDLQKDGIRNALKWLGVI